MTKKIVIISARGEQSFTANQLKKLTLIPNTTFIASTQPLSETELISHTHDAEIVALTRRSAKHLPAKILKQMKQLKGLVVYSTGYEWIDHYYTDQHGIKISYLKNYSTHSVAEHTMGLMLTMSRRIHVSYDKARNIIPEYVSARGRELRNKKLGIIGFGRIGQRVAHLASGFGMKIYYYDRVPKQAVTATYLPLDILLSTCDMISLHASRKYGEEPILDANHIANIKKGACIINSSRPELIQTDALISAIRDRQIIGYAVDELLDRTLLKSLSDYGRVLETGHSAWYSTEALDLGLEEWTNNIYAMAMNQPENILRLENQNATA
jgi:lactate dehydrogenase-like 2-hydroxyacid dehydrogenase